LSVSVSVFLLLFLFLFLFVFVFVFVLCCVIAFSCCRHFSFAVSTLEIELRIQYRANSISRFVSLV
jgi:hypothetical protein